MTQLRMIHTGGSTILGRSNTVEEVEPRKKTLSVYVRHKEGVPADPDTRLRMTGSTSS